jgi:hypothetical protein
MFLDRGLDRCERALTREVWCKTVGADCPAGVRSRSCGALPARRARSYLRRRDDDASRAPASIAVAVRRLHHDAGARTRAAAGGSRSRIPSSCARSSHGTIENSELE